MEPNEPTLKVISSLVNDINNSAPDVKSIEQLIKESLIPQGIKIPEPDTVFEINSIPVFTKKSIGTLIGRAKSGKTTVTAWIVAQSIKQSISTVWIDTEQGLYYGSRTQFWILNIANTPKSEYLQFYDLKIFPPNERVEMIELIINELRPDLVIIDGIRDLVFDINNPEEATKRTGDLMRWADIYDCHVLNILHQNKGNEHARGHLGTEMINKSETVIRVEQDDEGLIVCNPEYTRSKAFDIFAFNRDDHGVPFVIDGYSGKISTSSESSRRKKGPDAWDPAYSYIMPEITEYIFSVNQFLSKGGVTEKITDYFAKHGVKAPRDFYRQFLTRLEEVGIVWQNPYVKSKGSMMYEKNPQFAGEIPKVENLNKEGILSTKSGKTEDTPF